MSDSRPVVVLSFQNKHYNPVQVLWVNGQRSLISTLNPGESYQQGTHEGEIWEVEDQVTSTRLVSVLARSDEAVEILGEERRMASRNNAGDAIDASHRPTPPDVNFALDFDGENDVVIVPDSDNLQLGDDWTLEAWVFRNGRNREDPILEKSDGETGGFSMRIGANNRLQAGVLDGTTFLYGEGETEIRPRRWYHVAASFNGRTDFKYIGAEHLVKIFDDRGSGAGRNVAFYRPDPPSGYVSLGDYAQSDYGDPVRRMLVARNHPDIVALPVGYEPVRKGAYTPFFTTRTVKYSIWRPIPPDQDHAVLGYVVKRGHGEPSLKRAYCVKKAHLEDAPFEEVPVWSNELSAFNKLLAEIGGFFDDVGDWLGGLFGIGGSQEETDAEDRLSVSVWGVKGTAQFVANASLGMPGSSGQRIKPSLIADSYSKVQCYVNGRREPTTMHHGLDLESARAVLDLSSRAFLSLHDIELGDTFAIELWVNPQSAAGAQCFIDRREGENGVTLGFDDGKIAFGLNGRTHLAGDSFTGWHHLAVVVERQEPANESLVTLYLDGLPLWSQTFGTVAVSSAGSSWTLGADRTNPPSQTARHFEGQIAELRLWNTGRTAEDIRTYWNREIGNAPGLEAYWPLNDGAESTRILDYSNDARHVSQRSLAKAMEFDGEGGHVALPTIDADFTRGFTIEAWVFYRDFNANTPILHLGGAGTSDAIVLANTGAALELSVYRDNEAKSLSWPNALETGVWMHLAAAVDRSGQFSLFRDGELLADDEGFATDQFQVAEDQGWLPKDVERSRNYIGTNDPSADKTFSGYVAEVRLWSRARHAQQIAQNRLYQLTRDDLWGSVVGYWRLNGDASDFGGRLNGTAVSGAAGTEASFRTTDLRLHTQTADRRAHQWNTQGGFRLLPFSIWPEPSSAPLKIGALEPRNSLMRLGLRKNMNFNGLLDSIRVWDGVRTDGDIVGHWNQKLLGDERGLAGYWRCDEGMGSTVGDLSPNGNIGRFGGANRLLNVRVWTEARSQTAIEAGVDALRAAAVLDDGQSPEHPSIALNGEPVEEERLTRSVFLDDDFTIEAGIKVDTLILSGREHYVVFKQDTWALLILEERGELYLGFTYDFEANAAGGAWHNLLGDVPVTHKSWVHVAIVGKRSASPDELVFYIDGEEVKRQEGLPAFRNSNQPIRVGEEGRPKWSVSSLQLMDGLWFDGDDDYVELPPMETDFSRGFTVEAWVYFNQFRSWSRIVDLGNGAASDNIVLANEGETNNLSLSVFHGNEERRIVAPSALTLGQWIHVAATIDRDGTYILYVNGEEKARETYRSAGATAWLPGAFVMDDDEEVLRPVRRDRNYIGRSNWDHDAFLDGKIDELRLWKTRRTPRQIEGYMRRVLPEVHEKLVGLWHFDEGGGITAYDSTANGYHGLLGAGVDAAMPAWEVPASKVQTGLLFESAGDYVALPPMELDFSAGLTIETWVTSLTLGGTAGIVELSGPEGADRIALAAEDDNLMFGLKRGDEEVRIVVADVLTTSESEASDWLETADWTHVAVTIDGEGRITLYVNGKVGGTQQFRTESGEPWLPTPVTRTLNTIGSGAEGARPFHGVVDEVRIWGIARTQQQIQANLYSHVRTDAPKLIGYWPMDENGGSRVRDKSANQHHGRLEGGPQWVETSSIQFDGYTFDGAAEFVEIPASHDLDRTVDFSITAWVRPNRFRGLQGIFTKVVDIDNSQYALSLEGEMLRFDYERDGNNFAIVGGKLKDGWNHVAVTVKMREQNTIDVAASEDGTVAEPIVFVERRERLPKIHLYVNGFLVHSDTAPLETRPNDAPVVIGAWGGTIRSHFFHGTIDAVVLWKTALSQRAIQENKDQRLPEVAETAGYWRLDARLVREGLADASGNDRAGMLGRYDAAGGAAYYAPRPALSFDGSTSFAELGIAELGERFTVELWVRPESGGGTQCVVGKQNGLGQSVVWVGFRDGNLLCEIGGHVAPRGGGASPRSPSHGLPPAGQDGTGGVTEPERDSRKGDDAARVINTSDSLQAGEALLDWCHVAVVVEQQEAVTSRVVVYLDGAERARGIVQAVANVTGAWQLGASLITGGGRADFFRGQIAEVRLWNVARTINMIEADRQRLLGGEEEGLVDYWRFEEAAGNVVVGGFDGLFHNTTTIAVSDLRLLTPEPPPETIGLPPSEEDVLAAADRGLTFNGSGDYAELSDLDPGTPFTIELWVNPVSATDGQCFIGKHTSQGKNLIRLGFHDGGLLFALRGEERVQDPADTGSERPPKTPVTGLDRLLRRAITPYLLGLIGVVATVMLFFSLPPQSAIEIVFTVVAILLLAGVIAGFIRRVMLARADRSEEAGDPGRSPAPRPPNEIVIAGQQFTGWHHLAVVVETQEDASRVSIYTDGALLEQRTLRVVAGDLSGRPWVLGMDWDEDRRTDFFHGQMAEVRLWNAARTAQEIQRNFNLRLFGSEAGLLGFWRLDRDEGVTARGAALEPMGGGLALRRGPSVSFLTFDGQEAHATLPDVAPGDGFTFELWVDPQSTADQWFVSCVSQAGVTLFALGFAGDQVVASVSGRRAAFGPAFTGWRHLAVSVTPGADPRAIHDVVIGSNVTVYVSPFAGGFDGTAPDITEAFVDVRPAQAEDGGVSWLLGIPSGDEPPQAFAGRMAEVRLWTSIRNADQIDVFKDRRLFGSESGLAGYWPLDDDSDDASDTLRDRTPAARHGQRAGAAVVTVAEEGAGLALAGASEIRMPPQRTIEHMSLKEKLLAGLLLPPAPGVARVMGTQNNAPAPSAPSLPPRLQPVAKPTASVAKRKVELAQPGGGLRVDTVHAELDRYRSLKDPVKRQLGRLLDAFQGGMNGDGRLTLSGTTFSAVPGLGQIPIERISRVPVSLSIIRFAPIFEETDTSANANVLGVDVREPNFQVDVPIGFEIAGQVSMVGGSFDATLTLAYQKEEESWDFTLAFQTDRIGFGDLPIAGDIPGIKSWQLTGATLSREEEASLAALDPASEEYGKLNTKKQYPLALILSNATIEGTRIAPGLNVLGALELGSKDENDGELSFIKKMSGIDRIDFFMLLNASGEFLIGLGTEVDLSGTSNPVFLLARDTFGLTEPIALSMFISKTGAEETKSGLIKKKTDRMPPTITVEGVTYEIQDEIEYVTGNATEILDGTRKISLGDLSPGDKVEVVQLGMPPRRTESAPVASKITRTDAGKPIQAKEPGLPRSLTVALGGEAAVSFLVNNGTRFFDLDPEVDLDVTSWTWQKVKAEKERLEKLGEGKTDELVWDSLDDAGGTGDYVAIADRSAADEVLVATHIARLQRRLEEDPNAEPVGFSYGIEAGTALRLDAAKNPVFELVNTLFGVEEVQLSMSGVKRAGEDEPDLSISAGTAIDLRNRDEPILLVVRDFFGLETVELALAVERSAGEAIDINAAATASLNMASLDNPVMRLLLDLFGVEDLTMEVRIEVARVAGKPTFAVSATTEVELEQSESEFFAMIGDPDLFDLQTIAVTLSVSEKDFEISIDLGVDAELSDAARLVRTYIEIQLQHSPPPPSSYMGLGITFELDTDDSVIKLLGTLGVTSGVTGVSIDGTVAMQGKWHNPFGAEGLVVADLAAQIGLQPDPPWLSKVGLAGKLELGKTYMELAMKADLDDPRNSGFVGEVRDLALVDVINTLTGPDNTIPRTLSDVLEDVRLNQLKLSFIPHPPMEIGPVVYDEEGVTALCDLEMWGFEAFMYLQVNYTDGITGFASFTDFELVPGVLKIARFEPNGGRSLAPRPNLPARFVSKGGPELYMQLSPYDAPEIFIQGEVTLFGGAMRKAVAMYLNEGGLEFVMEESLFGLFATHLQARVATDFSSIYIKAEMQNDFFATIRKQVTDGIQAAADEALAEIREAKKDVEKIYGEIERMRVQVKAERQAVQNKLRKAKSKIDGAKRKVKKIKREIDKTKRYYDRLPDTDWPWNESKITEWVWVGPKLAGLYTAYGVATAVLEAAKVVLDGIDKLIDVVPIDSDPRIVLLFVGYGTAKGVLAAVEATVTGVASLATELANMALGEFFDIRYAMFEGDFSTVGAGTFDVSMRARIVFLGRQHEISFTLDLKALEHGVAGLVDDLLANYV